MSADGKTNLVDVIANGFNQKRARRESLLKKGSRRTKTKPMSTIINLTAKLFEEKRFYCSLEEPIPPKPPPP